MNRRDFLRPRQLATRAGQVLGALDDLQTAVQEVARPRPVVGPEFALVHYSRQAMATTFEVMLPLGTPQALKAAQDALDEINRLEEQLTVYRDTSEVSRLNRAAAFTAIPVDEGLFGLLQTAARISEATRGAYDISSGTLIKAWGFFRGPAHVPSGEDRARALQRVGMKHVVLDPKRRTVRYLCHGLEINLGSIGKGYALDRAADLLRQRWNFSSVLLHGGHSSLYAIGTEPGTELGWAVALNHPWDPDRQFAVLRLRNQGLGTSAATFRHLEHQGASSATSSTRGPVGPLRAWPVPR